MVVACTGIIARASSIDLLSRLRSFFRQLLERRYRLFVDMPVSILPVISFGIDDGDVYGYSTLNINCCVDLGTIFTRLKSRTEKEIM